MEFKAIVSTCFTIDSTIDTTFYQRFGHCITETNYSLNQQFFDCWLNSVPTQSLTGLEPEAQLGLATNSLIASTNSLIADWTIGWILHSTIAHIWAGIEERIRLCRYSLSSELVGKLVTVLSFSVFLDWYESFRVISVGPGVKLQTNTVSLNLSVVRVHHCISPSIVFADWECWFPGSHWPGLHRSNVPTG